MVYGLKALLGSTNIQSPKPYCRSNFVKGIIHIIDDENNFEVHQENFFSTHLEKNGQFLSLQDLQLRMEDLLFDELNFETKEDEVYGVLIEFNFSYSRDYYGESDLDIEIINSQFSKFDDEYTKYFSDSLNEISEKEILCPACGKENIKSSDEQPQPGLHGYTTVFACGTEVDAAIDQTLEDAISYENNVHIKCLNI